VYNNKMSNQSKFNVDDLINKRVLCYEIGYDDEEETIVEITILEVSPSKEYVKIKIDKTIKWISSSELFGEQGVYKIIEVLDKDGGESEKKLRSC